MDSYYERQLVTTSVHEYIFPRGLIFVSEKFCFVFKIVKSIDCGVELNLGKNERPTRLFKGTLLNGFCFRVYLFCSKR